MYFLLFVVGLVVFFFALLNVDWDTNDDELDILWMFEDDAEEENEDE